MKNKKTRSLSIFQLLNYVLSLSLFLCVLPIDLSAAEYEPWGKDADLTKLQPQNAVAKAGAGFESIIWFHQKVISPADGPRSHFFPSSSQYMLKAIRKHGLFSGYLMGCDRLMRENGDRWLYPLLITRDGDTLKSDPVP